MQEELLISKDMTIDDVFQNFPSKAQKLAQIMTNVGLSCVGCNASTFETIEQGMKVHGMSQKEVTSLVKELNTVLKEKEESQEDIKFTDFAAEKCKGFRKENSHMFKVGLVKGSCGWTYEFKFKENKEESDLVFEDKGIKILISKEDTEKLKGMVIDYVDGLQGAGFKILNPNVKGTCGCGSSVML
ncbi:MAG: iron-sulfur cluster assembly accessory protein [Nanoarchaeota archaeon]|nr:iron-sulfur cluster assembly accessory protein [Nanoarchaeota archaeon]|tara:strand:- start:2216 stop:2773 length:558 start_codon:yes stop_codon:yes gene_type:complete